MSGEDPASRFIAASAELANTVRDIGHDVARVMNDHGLTSHGLATLSGRVDTLEKRKGIDYANWLALVVSTVSLIVSIWTARHTDSQAKKAVREAIDTRQLSILGLINELAQLPPPNPTTRGLASVASLAEDRRYRELVNAIDVQADTVEGFSRLHPKNFADLIRVIVSHRDIETARRFWAKESTLPRRSPDETILFALLYADYARLTGDAPLLREAAARLEGLSLDEKTASHHDVYDVWFTLANIYVTVSPITPAALKKAQDDLEAANRALTALQNGDPATIDVARSDQMRDLGTRIKSIESKLPKLPQGPSVSPSKRP